MNRIAAVAAVLALLVAGCAVDRESDDVLAEDVFPLEADGQSGGDQADDGDGTEDSIASTTTIAPVAPPTTGAPNDVALAADFGDASWEITHGELNDLVIPTQENEAFVNLVFQGVPPPDFALTVLTENLFSQAVQAELAAAGGEVTAADLAASEESLVGQVEGLLAATADPAAEARALYDSTPYLGFLVRYQAAQDALTAVLAENAGPADGLPCVRHILVETEPEGDDIQTRLAAGEDFAELAIELSTGPSGPTGGDLGCGPSAQYVPPFAEAVDNAEIGQFVGPVQTDFGWHVIVVERTEVDGRAIASELLQERVSTAAITLDENLGTWDPSRLAITPAGA